MDKQNTTPKSELLTCPYCGRPIRDTQHALNEVGRLEARNEELRRFIKKVRDYSNDGWLAREADELIILYGDPDAAGPRGVINANAQVSNARRLSADEETAALERFRPMEGE